ncbi:hypothetical protein RFI_23042, partial [Reticulomyxa filosa]
INELNGKIENLQCSLKRFASLGVHVQSSGAKQKLEQILEEIQSHRNVLAAKEFRREFLKWNFTWRDVILQWKEKQVQEMGKLELEVVQINTQIEKKEIEMIDCNCSAANVILANTLMQMKHDLDALHEELFHLQKKIKLKRLFQQCLEVLMQETSSSSSACSTSSSSSSSSSIISSSDNWWWKALLQRRELEQSTNDCLFF